MSLLGRLVHHKGGRKSLAGRPPVGKESIEAPPESAKLEVGMESPPLIFHGDVQNSQGALMSGKLLLVVFDSYIRIHRFEMQLLAKLTFKMPAVKDCPDCQTSTTELKKWIFLREPRTFAKGVHDFPFSYLLPGCLAASSESRLGSVEYQLTGSAVAPLETISVQRTLDIRRALLLPELNQKTSSRIYPPTTLEAEVTFQPVIHPMGQFNMSLHMTGVASKDESHYRFWKLNQCSWRIDEQVKITSAPCDKHASETGDEGECIQYKDTRSIGTKVYKKGWKSDHPVPSTPGPSHGGAIDFEFQAGVQTSLKPTCDVETPNGFVVTHALVVELFAIEELAPLDHIKWMSPTGVARIMRASFNVVLTERGGLGISWDEEQPPVYGDVPASPPHYVSAQMEDYMSPPPEGAHDAPWGSA